MSKFITIRISKQIEQQLKDILKKSEPHDQGIFRLINEQIG